MKDWLATLFASYRMLNAEFMNKITSGQHYFHLRPRRSGHSDTHRDREILGHPVNHNLFRAYDKNHWNFDIFVVVNQKL